MESRLHTGRYDYVRSSSYQSLHPPVLNRLPIDRTSFRDHLSPEERNTSSNFAAQSDTSSWSRHPIDTQHPCSSTCSHCNIAVHSSTSVGTVRLDHNPRQPMDTLSQSSYYSDQDIRPYLDGPDRWGSLVGDVLGYSMSKSRGSKDKYDCDLYKPSRSGRDGADSVLGRQEESQGQHVRPFFGKKIEHTQGFASATKSWPNIQAIYPSNSTQAVSPSNKATTVGHKAGSRSIFRWERFLKPSELSSRSNEDEKFGLNQSPPTASPRPLFTHYQVRSPEALRQSTYHVNHSNPGTYPKPTEPIPILHFQDDPAIRFQEKFMTDKEIQTMDPVRNATRSPGLETSLFSWQHLETRELDSENGRTCSSSKAAGRGTKATKKKAMTKTRRPQKDPVIICQPTSFNPEEHAKFFRTTDGPTKRDADGTVGGRKADVGDRTCGLCNLPNSKMRVISNRLSSNEVVEMMAHDGQESGDTVILADQSYQQPQDQMIDQIASPSSEYPGSFSGYPYYTTTSAERNLARSASHHTLPTATGRQEAKRPSSLSIIPTPEKANTTQSNANLAPGPSIASDGSIPSFSQSSQSDIPLPRPLNYTKRPTSVTPKIPAIPAPLKSLQHPTQNSLRALTPQEQESSKDRATLLTAPVSQPPFKMTRACRELLLGHRSSLLCHEEEEEDAYEPVIKISKEEKAMRNMMLTPNRLIPGQPLIAPTWKQKCDEWGWNMAVVGMDKELLAVEIEEQQALVEDALKRLEELKVSWKEVVEEEKKLLESEEARGEGGDAEGERQ